MENKKYIAEEYKDKFPKANVGKSCIRFRTVKDIDLSILKEVIKKAEKVGEVSKI